MELLINLFEVLTILCWNESCKSYLNNFHTEIRDIHRPSIEYPDILPDLSYSQHPDPSSTCQSHPLMLEFHQWLLQFLVHPIDWAFHCCSYNWWSRLLWLLDWKVLPIHLSHESMIYRLLTTYIHPLLIYPEVKYLMMEFLKFSLTIWVNFISNYNLAHFIACFL